VPLLSIFAYTERSHGTVMVKRTDHEILADYKLPAPPDYGKVTLDIPAVCPSRGGCASLAST
jgi:hypothetical protein